MTSAKSPPERLSELLETLPAEERRAITAWLLGLTARQDPLLPLKVGHFPGLARGLGPDPQRLRSELALNLPAGEGSQLVTIRLPAERHAQLRSWCAEHSFTMAAVVRGLVERFLEQQGSPRPERRETTRAADQPE
jgi:hypothetical protein